MPATKKRDGEPGTTDQWPSWKGPQEIRPRGYRPTKGDLAVDRKAAGENLADPDGSDAPGDFERTRRRAFAPSERDGRQDGSSDAYWRRFFAVR